jgi:hypothetical protein
MTKDGDEDHRKEQPKEQNHAGLTLDEHEKRLADAVAEIPFENSKENSIERADQGTGSLNSC